MERREALIAGAAAATALAGCSRLIAKHARGAQPEALPPPDGSSKFARLVSRTTFGHRPGDIARAAQLGQEAFVAGLLRAAQPEEPRLTVLLHRLDVLRLDSETLRDLPHAEVVRQLQQAALLRAVYGSNQLLERMVDFWTNHFNIYALKEEGGYLLSRDLSQTIRANALGKFPDMLKASAKSPAMLIYLDNQMNQRGVPNENYARELLELHSMGVHGGYTQRDVMSVARCFTGWSYENRFLRPRGRFRFIPELHDDGPKDVLGHKVAPCGGVRDGERVLDIISGHHSTARFIAGKLCREFLGKEDSGWTARLAKVYLDTGGDIKQMIEPLLVSEDLTRAPLVVKRPFDYVASALRATDASTDCGGPVLRHLEKMGHSPHLWPMPDGYPTKTSAWSGSLLGRWNFALQLTGGHIQGTEVDLEPLIAHADDRAATYGAVSLILGRKPAIDDPLVRMTAAAASPADAAALCLASPEFQWR